MVVVRPCRSAKALVGAFVGWLVGGPVGGPDGGEGGGPVDGPVGGEEGGPGDSPVGGEEGGAQCREVATQWAFMGQRQVSKSSGTDGIDGARQWRVA